MAKDLNEVKQAVILAAGRSRRMEHLSKKMPKCLLPYKGERIISRLVRQIKACGIERIVITIGYRADILHEIFDEDPNVILVENKNYEEDVNIYSMSLALAHIDGPCAIFEADTVMEDALVEYVTGSDFESKSVWFTKGKFNYEQYGGILKSNKYGEVTEVRIVSAWQEEYARYTKLSGLMKIGGDELKLFTALINKYAKTTLKQYYLNAWIENIKLLPSIEADISFYQFFTFNKPEEYYQLQNTDIGMKEVCPETEIINVNDLKHIEEFNLERVENLKEKIISDGKWTVPLIVDKKGLVLDGQHRMEVAKLMELKVVPAIVVDYDNVNVWTLRKEYKVSQKMIEKKVSKGEIYPYKTVKHNFRFSVPVINVAIEELK